MSLIETGLNFYTPNGCNSYTGYGRLELGIARGMKTMGVPLNIAPDPAAPTLVIGYTDWLEAPHVVNTRRWIVTQSESTKVSQKWVNLINWNAEAVLLTNHDLIQIYHDSGVKRPIYCVGHGVDMQVPIKAPGWDGQSRFEWLTYSYGDMRKGSELAIFAFKKLFDGDERHHLTIKARDGKGHTWLDGLRDPQISIVFGQQTEHEWMQLLAKSHAFIFPSRAEGFGMPPREATLIGVPTVATSWLGLADVDKWGYPVRVAEMRQTQYSFEAANATDSKWAEPDLEHLAEQMAAIYHDYETARKKALAGRWYIRQTNSWDVVARKIRHYMEQTL